MKRYSSTLFLISFALATIVLVSCSGDKQAATPVETFQTYVKALKKKDLTTVKLLLSKDTIKMHEQEAKSEGVNLDDIVKRDTLLGAGQSRVRYRNEKIDGDKATIEFEDAAGIWETLPFVREDGEWKIDKKGYADQLERDVEQNSQQFDDMMNRSRQP